MALSLLLALMPGASNAIEVAGERIHFLKHVHAAISLLRARVPHDYREIAKYVGRVQEAESWHHGRIVPWSRPPTFWMDRGTASHSVTWAAGAIAHEACHSRLWHEYSTKHARIDVPLEAWGGQEKELRCIRYQIEVMMRINAPAHEIEFLRQQDGLHYTRKLPFPPFTGYRSSTP